MTSVGSLPIEELVAGRLMRPAEELDVWHTDSDTGERLERSRASAADSVDLALAAAAEAHRDGRWRGLSGTERGEHLLRFSEELAAVAECLAAADSSDSGVLLSTTRELCGMSAGMPAGLGQLALGLLSSESAGAAGPVAQRWLPWGPAAVFSPWNAPTTTALGKASFALAAGAPVILKPSEWAQHSASLIARAAVAAGLPDGVLQVVHGGAGVGQQVASDPRVAAISYTGGSVGGRAVAAASACHLRPLDLELSGSNAVVVLPDADLDEAASEIAAAMLFLNGQWCAGPTRVITPEGSVEALKQALLERLAGVRIGPSRDAASELGPLAHASHVTALERQLTQLADLGATVQRTGKVPEGSGHFFAPAVVTGPATEAIHDELFGPAVTVQGYRDEDDAVRRANQGVFGLSAYVFAEEWEAALAVGQQLRAGLVGVNKIRPVLAPPTPDAVASMWAGSGLGSVGMAESLRFYTGARLIH
jgi:phenylacetaldehyde dehydrogenase